MIKDLEQLLGKQQAKAIALRQSTAHERKEKLTRLEKAIVAFREKLKEAIYQDFGKPYVETDITEIAQALIEVRYMKKNVANWMRQRKVPTPLSLLGTSSYIRPEPKGTVLVISPWNYPINLCLVPVIGAIAAGNTVVLKPSELTPQTSKTIQELYQSVFAEDEVAVVLGGVEESKALLALKFNHIFFTGSSRVGKLVMEAASRHLADVTLELGGKSPVILDASAPLNLSMRRIVWSKMVNCGQTCIAPDYLLVHESHREGIITIFKEHIKEMFGEDPATSADLGRIVTKKHYDRLIQLLDEAEANGAKLSRLGKNTPSDRFVTPHIVSDIDDQAKLMSEEIFGPILPVKFYARLEEAIHYINQGKKPLALYIYAKKRANIDRIMKETSSGAIVVNQGLIHFSNYFLPFGGVNNSGVGRYHGKFSFDTFSHEKAIVKQWLPISASTILAAPYSGFVKRVANFMVRWM